MGKLLTMWMVDSVRPLRQAEIRARKLTGRCQITTSGRRLVDGVPWGRPFVRLAMDRDRGMAGLAGMLQESASAEVSGGGSGLAVVEQMGGGKGGEKLGGERGGERMGGERTGGEKKRRRVEFQQTDGEWRNEATIEGIPVTTLARWAMGSDEEEDEEDSDFEPGKEEESDEGSDEDEEELGEGVEEEVDMNGNKMHIHRINRLMDIMKDRE